MGLRYWLLAKKTWFFVQKQLPFNVQEEKFCRKGSSGLRVKIRFRSSLSWSSSVMGITITLIETSEPACIKQIQNNNLLVTWNRLQVLSQQSRWNVINLSFSYQEPVSRLSHVLRQRKFWFSSIYAFCHSTIQDRQPFYLMSALCSFPVSSSKHIWS